jgi:predicted outer membrane repeat protein
MSMSAKRALSAALALLLAVSFAAPSDVRADSDAGFAYTVTNGAATVTGCTSPCPAALVIPDTLGGITVTAIGASAFYGAGLASLVIPDSVTAIGFRSFAGNSLNAVTLGASLATIGDYAFFLNALTSIRIPATVTAIGSQAFRYNSLTNVTFAGNAPTAGSLVLADNSALTRVFRSVSASGWVATWGGIQVVNFEQAETWVARGATSDDDVNGETAGTSCAQPDYIAGPTNADVQIQLGLDDTVPNGIVHLCPGVYNITASLHSVGVTLIGESATTTILDGGATWSNGTYDSGGVLILEGGDNLVVSGLAFRKGRGAITGSTVTISASTFTNNHSENAGGAISSNSTVTLHSSTFTNNSANTIGGAIFSSFAGGVTADHVVFDGNSAGTDGGAIYTYLFANITTSTFTNNSAVSLGGAIFVTSGTVDVASTTFSGNTAASGALVYASDGGTVCGDPQSAPGLWESCVLPPTDRTGSTLTPTLVILAGLTAAAGIGLRLRGAKRA